MATVPPGMGHGERGALGKTEQAHQVRVVNSKLCSIVRVTFLDFFTVLWRGIGMVTSDQNYTPTPGSINSEEKCKSAWGLESPRTET